MESMVAWQGGVNFAGGIPGNVEAVRLGDGDDKTRVSTMQLLLISVAGCTAMDVLSILHKKRQTVTSLEVRVRGERAPDHPIGFCIMNGA